MNRCENIYVRMHSALNTIAVPYILIEQQQQRAPTPVLLSYHGGLPSVSPFWCEIGRGVP